MNASQLTKLLGESHSTMNDAIGYFKARLIWFAPKHENTNIYNLGELEQKILKNYFMMRKGGSSLEEAIDICVSHAHELKFGWYKKGLGSDL